MKSNAIKSFLIPALLLAALLSAQESENMNLIGRWGLGSCKAVSADGSYLLMGSGSQLQVIEVSGIRPYLNLRGQVLMPGVISDIAIAWPRAFVACENGVSIVDLSVPSSPVVYGPFSTGGKAVGLDVYGEYVFVANLEKGMTVFKIGSGSILESIGTSFKPAGEIWDVWADENIVYAAAGSAGFWTVNVTNKYAPVLLDSVHLGGTVKSLYIQGSTAYLACGTGGLKQVSIANRSNLVKGSTWTAGESMDATDVYILASRAYVTDARFGLRVVDVSTPTPAILSNLSTRGAAAGITLDRKNNAFVAMSGAGLLLLNVFGTTPIRIDSLASGDISRDVLMHGNLVYVAGGQSGLWILDRSKASASTIGVIARFPEFTACQGLAMKDNLLFVADGTGGIKVFDLSQPKEPVRLSTRSVTVSANDLDVYGNQVVVADGTSGLHLYGISNPSELSDAGTISLGATTARRVKVDLSRNLAYVSTSSGTKIVDLQNKTLLASCPGSSDAYASDFSGEGNNRLIVADGTNGIMGFDATNASAPRLVDQTYYDTPGTAYDVLIRGNAAIVADGSGTVRIVDMTSTPKQVGYHHTAGSSLRLDLSGDTLAVADGEAGIYLFKGNFSGTLITSQTLLDFATVVVGKKRVLSLELTNTGTTPVLVNNVSSSSGRFISESGLPFTVLPGSRADMMVAFSPQAQQTLNDVLTVTSDANNSPLRVNVRGTGIVTTSLEPYTSDVYTFLLYHMNAIVRDSLVLDESQYGLMDGVTKNTVLSEASAGRFGRALVFDNAADRVRVRTDSMDHLPEFNGFTADTWFKLSQNQTGRKIIFKITQATRTLFELGVDDYESKRVLEARSMSSAQDTVRLKSAGYGLSLNTWYHAALVYDGSFKLYLNGTRVDSVRAPLYEDNTAIAMVLGSTAAEGGIVGSIDEFRLSGVARAPWEFNVSTGRISVSATGLDFGNVMLPYGRTRPVWVQNTGIGTLWVDSIKTTNPRYVVTPQSMTLAPGASATAMVTFTPVAAGVTGGVLNIYSKDPFNPLKSVTLTGSGYNKGEAGAYLQDVYTVGLWHCDGTSPDTVLQDYSSYNLKGALRGSGVAWNKTVTRWGTSSLAFTGGLGWVRVPYNQVLNFASSPFTVEMWFRMAAKPQSGTWSLMKRGWGSTGQYEILYGDSLESGRGLSARLISSSGQNIILRVPSDRDMQTGGWYHVALTWDKSKLRLFLNGSQVDSTAFSGSLRSSTADLSIGGAYGKGSGFNGTIDEIRFSNINRQGWEFNLVGPRLLASAYSLTFGQVLLGESQTQDLTLSNSGDQTLVVTAVKAGTRSFSAQPSSLQVPMGQNQTVRVVFMPQATGILADSLLISSNDPNQGTAVVRLSGTGVNYRSKIAYGVDDHTVALFHFDETTGTTAVDSKNNLHNGTLTNGVARISNGYFGGALHFDGKDDYVTVPGAEDLVFDMASKSVTIECFFKTDTISKVLFQKDIAGGTDKANYGLSIDASGRINALGFGAGGTWVADASWHHAALVYDAQTRYGTLYIDGSVILQKIWDSGLTETANPRALILGARETSAGSFSGSFEGDFDEFRISSVARKPWEFLLAKSGIDVALSKVPEVGKDLGVSITSDSSAQTVMLYYRKGGETAYATVAASTSDKIHYQAVVPGQAVTFNGLEYYAEKTTAGDKVTQPLYDAISRPIATAARFTSQNSGLTLPAKKYAMVSVPAALDKPGAASVLSDDMGLYDPTMWRCFTFKDTSYAEFSDSLSDADSSRFDLTRGKALWVISAQAKTFDVGAGTTTALESPYRLTLKPQWNMIGSVFPFSVAWDDCALSSTSVGTPYYYDGTGYRLDWTTLEAWKGYWLYNAGTQEQTVYLPPRKAAETQAVAKRGVCSDLTDGEWIFRLSAESEQARDLDNFAGVRHEARDAWDVLDRAEPPPIGDYVALYMDKSDWTENAGTYAADIRQPGQEGYTWDFTFETSLARQTVTLRWEFKRSLPEGWVATLIHMEDGSAVSVLDKKSMTIVSGSQPTVRRYRFVAGTPAYVQKESEAAVPAAFHLFQNYPNPFNPETTIRYTLSAAGTATLTVYNMLGQRVKVLADGVQRAGSHQVVWDGSDGNGFKVSSGMYLYRLECEDRVAIRKLILVK